MEGNAGQDDGAIGQVVAGSRLLFGADEAVASWVSIRLQESPWVGCYSAIGVLDSNRSRLIAGVVYHGYDGTNIMQSTAADVPTWCRPGVLRGLFHYPFVTLGCRRMTALIEESNARSLSVTEKLGFKREGVLREFASDGGNAIVLGMLRKECRYLENTSG